MSPPRIQEEEIENCHPSKSYTRTGTSTTGSIDRPPLGRSFFLDDLKGDNIRGKMMTVPAINVGDTNSDMSQQQSSQQHDNNSYNDNYRSNNVDNGVVESVTRNCVVVGTGAVGAYRRTSYQQHNEYNYTTMTIQQQPVSLSTSTSTTKVFRKRIKSEKKSNSPILQQLTSITTSLSPSSLSSTLSKRRRQQQQQQHQERNHSTVSIFNVRSIVSCIENPTISLPILVLIDMLAVSFVIPLLFQYYQRAGIHNANQRELLSSVFNAAQIVGGITLGILTDSGIVQRKTLLLISFVGSAVSYGLIVYGGISALLFSRVLVGFVKHTMTVVTTIMSKITSSSDRAIYMGRISACSTVAWIIGPSIGSLFYKYCDHRAPALIACFLFILNAILVTILIPNDKQMEKYYHTTNTTDITSDNTDDTNEDIESDLSSTEGETKERNEKEQKQEVKSLTNNKNSNNNKGLLKMIQNIRTCFTSKVLASVVITKIIITWVGQATNYSSLGSFYEDMYGLEAHHRGYISSYQQALQFIVQSFFVKYVLSIMGGERKSTCIFTIVTAIAILLEIKRSLPFFIIILCPLISLSFSMINLSLQTLITHVAPNDAIFSVLATIDILQNIAHVSVPFYRTMIFQYLRPTIDSTTATIVAATTTRRMDGDPDPILWILSSGVHWIIASVCISYVLLLSNQHEWEKTENEYTRTHSSSSSKKLEQQPKTVKKGK